MSRVLLFVVPWLGASCVVWQNTAHRYTGGGSATFSLEDPARPGEVVEIETPGLPLDALHDDPWQTEGAYLEQTAARLKRIGDAYATLVVSPGTQDAIELCGVPMTRFEATVDWGVRGEPHSAYFYFASSPDWPEHVAVSGEISLVDEVAPEQAVAGSVHIPAPDCDGRDDGGAVGTLTWSLDPDVVLEFESHHRFGPGDWGLGSFD